MNDSIHERALRLAKNDNLEINERGLRNSYRHYFVHLFKLQNNIKSIGRVNGKLVITKY